MNFFSPKNRQIERRQNFTIFFVDKYRQIEYDQTFTIFYTFCQKFFITENFTIFFR